MTRNLDRIQVTEVGSFEGGPLEIRVSCTGSYSLQVTGRTTLDFTYQLSVVKNIDTGETRPLLGSPVKGMATFYSVEREFWMELHYRRSSARSLGIKQSV